MKPGFRWIVVDTETDGFMEPIHVVEIAAQAMDGWTPVGEPFRVLINHEIQIDAQAQQVHGYTEEFLRENGLSPVEAHSKFAEYVGTSPIVSHNLSFDWDRALVPEWQRLGLPAIGRRGFCTLMLSRRIIPEAQSHRLEALKEFYSLGSSVSHKAHNDVETLIELIERVIAPRLRRLTLDGFDSVKDFAALDSKRARAAVASAYGSEIAMVKRPRVKGDLGRAFTNKYYVARQGVIIGQFPISDLLGALKKGELFYEDYYWTQGMGKDWARLHEIKSLIESSAPKMASERQVAYLAWLGVSDAVKLTSKEAANAIQKKGGNLTYRSDGKQWNIERLILHPEIFSDELKKHLKLKVRRDCLKHHESLVFGSSELLDDKKLSEVFNKLMKIDVAWWSKEDFRDVFYNQLRDMYPKCCDGKSVYYEFVLPDNLHKHVRNLFIGCSERLTKAKVKVVMERISATDALWYKKENYHENFITSLRALFPGCCDGRDRVAESLEREKSNRLALESAISSLIPRATAGDVTAQYEVGKSCVKLGLLNGDGKFLEDAFNWLSMAAKSGNVEARALLVFDLSHYRYSYCPNRVECRAWAVVMTILDYPIGCAPGQSVIDYINNPLRDMIQGLILNLENMMDRESISQSDLRAEELLAVLKSVR